MTNSLSRRKFMAVSAASALAAPAFIRSAMAAPVPIRFGNAGAVGSGCIETLIFSPTMQKEVLPSFGRFGKDYTFSMILTKGSPEVVTLLAAGQVDIGTLSFSSLSAVVQKDMVPGGIKVIADSYQDSHGFSNTYAAKEDSPIKSIADLRGKRVATNGFGTGPDILLRLMLQRNGLDPKTDVELLEIGFPNMGAAIRQDRIDCGCMVQPFWAVEQAKGGVKAVFTQREIIGDAALLFHGAPVSFLKAQPDAVRAFFADYYDGMKWLYDPANREKVLEIGNEVTKSPIETLRPYFLTDEDYYHAPDGCLTAAMIQKPVDAMKEVGLTSSSIDVASVLDLSYLPGKCS
ncbi:MAG: ABC transporter substrate-binding protein [Rhizobiaceae bacterium]|nr:ABC transporter substrate-binding protein [Rhizobiaceae bacterium]